MISPDSSTKTGAMTGIVLTAMVNISTDQLLETVILSAVGGVVSFLVSYLLQLIRKGWR